MNILLLNGSPRLNGNTRTALNEISQGIKDNMSYAEVELIDVAGCKLSGCTNCNACKENGGNCILPDDSASIIQKLFDADVVVFGTPVYFWGITAQLKMVIDKIYSKDDKKVTKKVGVVAIGEAGLEDREYKMIKEQFELICNYLGWDVIFDVSISAGESGAVAKDTEKMKELKEIWKKF